MIIVEIYRNPDHMIHSFTMKGHAEFADRGEDIVCAGASAVAFGALNAVMALTGVKPKIEQAESGYLSCTLPNKLSPQESEQAQLLLEGMIVSLQTIERDYGEHIKIIFKNRR